MASLNRLKLPRKTKFTYRNEYGFSDTITKMNFGQFILILVKSYSYLFSLWSICTHLNMSKN